ncbi:MAG: hypothetical protein HFE46_03555 [Clostridia bacterium]|nr:hypothetical protein [Clostridia bacterium]
MDWGRLAFVKAEELETLWKKTARAAEKRTSACASFYPRAAAEAGYAPCAVEGTGNVGLSVWVRVSAPQGASGIKLWLYCGDKAAAYTAITLPEGGEGSYTLFASVYPSAREKLRLCADREGLIIEEMRVLAEGGDAALTAGQEGYRCDCLHNEIYMAREQNGTLYLQKYGNEQKTDVCHASVFDMLADDNGIAVLCSDDDGNLWGVKYAPDLTERCRVRLGDGFSCVAIGRNPTGYTLAAVKDRAVRLARCADDFSGLTAWEAADFSTEADEVYFCKQTLCPLLFLRRDGQLFAKLPMGELGGKETLRVAISLQTE